jgi:hypothetical protein
LRASRDQVDGAVLVIAGDGSQKELLGQQIASLGLSAHVRLLGLIDNVVTLHHALDVYVQSSDAEGTANSVLEALALETPLVATDVGGTTEVARHGCEALIVAKGDEAGLVESILQVIRHPEAASVRAGTAASESRPSFLLRAGRNVSSPCTTRWRAKLDSARRRAFMRELAKAALRGAGTLLILPRLVLFLCWSVVLERNRAFEGAMQGLARVPGIRGVYMRGAFLRWTIDACHPTATVSYGVLMSKTGAGSGPTSTSGHSAVWDWSRSRPMSCWPTASAFRAGRTPMTCRIWRNRYENRAAAP